MNIEYAVNKIAEKLQSIYGFNPSVRPMVRTVLIEAEQYNEKFGELQNRMNAGVVHFQYKKMDGSIREAWGTLNSAIIDSYPVNTVNDRNCRRRYCPDCITYFDVEKTAFRSFRKNHFMGLL